MINTLIKHGHLVEDARLHGGVRTITNESLGKYYRKRGHQRRGG